jgi:hypothetical protein
VRKFTLAVETPADLESTFSIVLAHEAHVIPLSDKSTRCSVAFGKVASGVCSSL